MRALMLFLFLLSLPAIAEGWKIDWSRRFKETPKSESTPSESPPPVEEPKSFLDRVFSAASEPAEREIVILQTENGFVPQKVQVRQNQVYKIDVVNVNEKEKNVSFILDAFSEHHAIYYGKIKSFVIQPKREGIYSFQSPETAFQGQIVVLPSEAPPSREFKLETPTAPATLPPSVRAPAAEE